MKPYTHNHTQTLDSRLASLDKNFSQQRCFEMLVNTRRQIRISNAKTIKNARPIIEEIGMLPNKEDSVEFMNFIHKLKIILSAQGNLHTYLDDDKKKNPFWITANSITEGNSIPSDVKEQWLRDVENDVIVKAILDALITKKEDFRELLDQDTAVFALDRYHQILHFIGFRELKPDGNYGGFTEKVARKLNDHYRSFKIAKGPSTFDQALMNYLLDRKRIHSFLKDDPRTLVNDLTAQAELMDGLPIEFQDQINQEIIMAKGRKDQNAPKDFLGLHKFITVFQESRNFKYEDFPSLNSSKESATATKILPPTEGTTTQVAGSMTTAVANIAPGGGNQNNGGQQKKNTRRGNRFNNKGFKAHNQNNFKPWQQQQQQPQYGNNGGGRGGQGRGGRGQAFNGGRGGRFNNAGRGQGRGGYMNGRGGFHGNNGNYNGNPQQGNNSNSGNNFGNNNFNGGFNNGNNNGGFFQPTPHTMMMNINELNGYNNNNRNQHHGNQSGNHHQNNNNQQAPYDAQWSADANRMARNNRSNHNNYSMNQQYNGYGNVTIAAMSRKVLDDPNNPVYFIDSGATFSHRVSAYRLSDITPNLTAVQTADGKCVYSREIGFIGNLRFHITPEFKYNLISVKELNKVHDWYAIFKNGICEVRDNTDILVFKTRESSSLGDSQELFCIDEMSLQLSLKVYWEKKVEEQLQKQAQAQVSVMSHEFCGTLPPIVFAALPAPQQCENHRIIDCQVCSDSVPPREVSQFLLIHSRLHCHLEKCKELLKYVEGFEKVTFRRRDQLLAPCKLCVESCMHSRGYAHQSSQDEIRTPFSVVHVDLKGPIEVTGVNGEKYILGIVDSYSKYIFQYYLKTKDEAHIYMEKFIVEHVTFVSKLWQSNRNNEPVTTIELILSSVISDQGGEFISANFRNTCERFGIRHSILPAYGPQLNGTVERTWKQVFQLVRIFLIQSQLPSKYWPFAAMHATYIINRTTLYSIKQHKSSKRGLTRGTPYQHLYLKKPNISHIKQFGCNLYTFIHPQQRDQPNFSPRAFEGKLLGFVDTFPNVHTAIVVQLNQINSIKPTIVTVDRDNCKYVEQQVFSYNTFNGDSVFSQELEQGTRLSTHDNPSVLSSVGQNNSSVMDEDTINMTIMDILNSPYAAQWIEAIKKEFQTIEKNNVWRLIDFLPGRGKKKLGTKWVFRTKTMSPMKRYAKHV